MSDVIASLETPRETERMTPEGRRWRGFNDFIGVWCYPQTHTANRNEAPAQAFLIEKSFKIKSTTKMNQSTETGQWQIWTKTYCMLL